MKGGGPRVWSIVIYAGEKIFISELSDKFEIDFRRRKEKIFDRVEKAGIFDLNTTFKDFDEIIPKGINDVSITNC